MVGVSNSPVVKLCGLQFDAVTAEQAIERILDALSGGSGGWIFSVNLDILRRWVRSADFRKEADATTMCLADGMPLIWASRLQGHPLPERVAGSDLISTLSAAAAVHGRSIYLLGGASGTAQQSAEILCSRSPRLQVVGTDCPPLGFEHSEQLMGEIRDALVAAKPDIVFVALGSPKQERLINYLRPALPNVWWMGVGASFSFLAGDIQRAPLWMQRCGLEWLHRLAHEPKRLAGRYLRDDVPFLLRLLVSVISVRFRRNR